MKLRRSNACALAACVFLLNTLLISLCTPDWVGASLLIGAAVTGGLALYYNRKERAGGEPFRSIGIVVLVTVLVAVTVLMILPACL